jgi:hypothetical protein
VASLLTVLSLNTNRRADLGGLHAIIRETKPHLVFLQEVISYDAAAALAATFGYTLTASTLHQAQRDLILATLSCLPATVQEVKPGRVQLVTVGALPFLNIHVDSQNLLAFFTSLRPHLNSPISPVLIGDFNCVQDPLDYSPGGPIRPPCPSLAHILHAHSYTDSYRSLHPTSRVYSFHRRGLPAARLDRAYLPPILESRPRVARYIPTSSDHHAYLFRLETAGLAILPNLGLRAASNSLYWKFNSSLLRDPKFLPAFRDMWLPLAATRPLPPAPDLSQPDPVQNSPIPDLPVFFPTPPAPALVTPSPPPDLLLDVRTPPQPQPLSEPASAPVHPIPDPNFSDTDLSEFSPSPPISTLVTPSTSSGLPLDLRTPPQPQPLSGSAPVPVHPNPDPNLPDPDLPVYFPAPARHARNLSLSAPMLPPTFPPFTPSFNPPPLAPARPSRPPRLARPLNPLAPAFVPAAATPPPPSPTPDPPAQDLDPPPPPEAADWWDQVAKPTIITFCQRYAAHAASRRFHLRRLASRALELALAASDWPAVEAARARLRTLDAAVAAGLAIRTHTPLADQEVAADFHHHREIRRGPSTGLCAVRTEAGEVLTSSEAVEREITSYFEALFQGRHVPSANNSGFVDSGSSFHPDPDLFPGLLSGLPSLSPVQQAELELPFTLGELQSAVEAAAASKAPGLDGLSYEFYKATFGQVGPSLLDGLNAMLGRGLLSPSLRHGVVRLLPKVPGVPMASQLRPITLLNTDYKLLTKMIVARLLPLLPTVLQATQLCSVQGRFIHDGPASVLSAAEFLHKHQLPGYLLSLDFFHAYDRVSLDWVDKVLEAMGFGLIFRGWISTLHREASASFLLHDISPILAILFSLRQGDPLAALLFIIHLEPFLVRLEAVLSGLRVANIREVSFGYMDDVQVLGDDLQDIIRVDLACRDFEAASGALLNRNRKTTIVGLGSWAGRQDWPLQWILASSSVKVLGFTITPIFPLTVQLSWDHVLSGMERTLAAWRTRRLDTLQQRVQVLEVFVLSRAWYIAHLLPLATSVYNHQHNHPNLVAPATRLCRLVGDFLWAGRFRRLAFDECHAKRSAGGLGLSCPQTRAQAMLAKQACRHLAAGGRPALHLAYWLGISLQGLLPVLASAGLMVDGDPPAQYADLLTLLREVFTLSCVDTANLQLVTSRDIYRELTCTLPTPRIERVRRDLPWHHIWPRLEGPCLVAREVDLHFSLLHNLLDVQANRHHWGVAPSPACQTCRPPAGPETTLHFFTSCPRTSAAWHLLFFRATIILGVALTDEVLLLLAWPPSTARADAAVVLAVTTFTAWAWSTRSSPEALAPNILQARVRRAADGGPLFSIL